MTKIKASTLLVTICSTLATESSLQGADTLSPESSRSTKPAVSGGLAKTSISAPSAPLHPIRTELPAEVKDLLMKFSATRDQFLDDQNALRQKYSNSSAEEREKLRTEMRQRRENFLQQQREAREDLRRRLAEIRPSAQANPGR